MDASIAAYVLAAFLASAFLKGITGLGFSTICLGMLASVVDIKIAIPLVLIPSLTSNVLVMVEAGRFRPALARFWVIFACAVPGLVIGLWLLDSVASAVASTCLGAVLLAYGVWALGNHHASLPPHLERWLNPPVGLSTGIINGLTGSQVMPVLPYLLSLRLDKNTFVQAINISFTISSLVMLSGLAKLGLLDWEKLGMSALGIAPVGLGIWLGGKVRRKLSETLFRKVVLVLLIGLGANLML